MTLYKFAKTTLAIISLTLFSSLSAERVTIEVEGATPLSFEARTSLKQALETGKRYAVDVLGTDKVRLLAEQDLEAALSASDPQAVLPALLKMVKQRPKDELFSDFVTMYALTHRNELKLEGPTLVEALALPLAIQMELEPRVFTAYPDFFFWVIKNGIHEKSKRLGLSWIHGRHGAPTLVIPKLGERPAYLSWLQMRLALSIGAEGLWSKSWDYSKKGIVPVGDASAAPLGSEHLSNYMSRKASPEFHPPYAWLDRMGSDPIELTVEEDKEAVNETPETEVTDPNPPSSNEDPNFEEEKIVGEDLNQQLEDLLTETEDTQENEEDTYPVALLSGPDIIKTIEEYYVVNDGLLRSLENVIIPSLQNQPIDPSAFNALRRSALTFDQFLDTAPFYPWRYETSKNISGEELLRIENITQGIEETQEQMAQLFNASGILLQPQEKEQLEGTPSFSSSTQELFDLLAQQMAATAKATDQIDEALGNTMDSEDRVPSQEVSELFDWGTTWINQTPVWPLVDQVTSNLESRKKASESGMTDQPNTGISTGASETTLLEKETNRIEEDNQNLEDLLNPNRPVDYTELLRPHSFLQELQQLYDQELIQRILEASGTGSEEAQQAQKDLEEKGLVPIQETKPLPPFELPDQDTLEKNLNLLELTKKHYKERILKLQKITDKLGDDWFIEEGIRVTRKLVRVVSTQIAYTKKHQRMVQDKNLPRWTDSELRKYDRHILDQKVQLAHQLHSLKTQWMELLPEIEKADTQARLVPVSPEALSGDQLMAELVKVTKEITKQMKVVWGDGAASITVDQRDAIAALEQPFVQSIGELSKLFERADRLYGRLITIPQGESASQLEKITGTESLQALYDEASTQVDIVSSNYTGCLISSSQIAPAQTPSALVLKSSFDEGFCGVLKDLYKQKYLLSSWIDQRTPKPDPVKVKDPVVEDLQWTAWELADTFGDLEKAASVVFEEWNKYTITTPIPTITSDQDKYGLVFYEKPLARATPSPFELWLAAENAQKLSQENVLAELQSLKNNYRKELNIVDGYIESFEGSVPDPIATLKVLKDQIHKVLEELSGGLTQEQYIQSITRWNALAAQEFEAMSLIQMMMNHELPTTSSEANGLVQFADTRWEPSDVIKELEEWLAINFNVTQAFERILIHGKRDRQEFKALEAAATAYQDFLAARHFDPFYYQDAQGLQAGEAEWAQGLLESVDHLQDRLQAALGFGHLLLSKDESSTSTAAVLEAMKYALASNKDAGDGASTAVELTQYQITDDGHFHQSYTNATENFFSTPFYGPWNANFWEQLKDNDIPIYTPIPVDQGGFLGNNTLYNFTGIDVFKPSEETVGDIEELHTADLNQDLNLANEIVETVIDEKQSAVDYGDFNTTSEVWGTLQKRYMQELYTLLLMNAEAGNNEASRYLQQLEGKGLIKIEETTPASDSFPSLSDYKKRVEEVRKQLKNLKKQEELYAKIQDKEDADDSITKNIRKHLKEEKKQLKAIARLLDTFIKKVEQDNLAGPKLIELAVETVTDLNVHEQKLAQLHQEWNLLKPQLLTAFDEGQLQPALIPGMTGEHVIKRLVETNQGATQAIRHLWEGRSAALSDVTREDHTFMQSIGSLYSVLVEMEELYTLLQVKPIGDQRLLDTVEGVKGLIELRFEVAKQVETIQANFDRCVAASKDIAPDTENPLTGMIRFKAAQNFCGMLKSVYQQYYLVGQWIDARGQTGETLPDFPTGLVIASETSGQRLSEEMIVDKLRENAWEFRDELGRIYSGNPDFFDFFVDEDTECPEGNCPVIRTTDSFPGVASDEERQQLLARLREGGASSRRFALIEEGVRQKKLDHLETLADEQAPTWFTEALQNKKEILALLPSFKARGLSESDRVTLMTQLQALLEQENQTQALVDDSLNYGLILQVSGNDRFTTNADNSFQAGGGGLVFTQPEEQLYSRLLDVKNRYGDLVEAWVRVLMPSAFEVGFTPEDPIKSLKTSLEDFQNFLDQIIFSEEEYTILSKIFGLESAVSSGTAVTWNQEIQQIVLEFQELQNLLRKAIEFSADSNVFTPPEGSDQDSSLWGDTVKLWADGALLPSEKPQNTDLVSSLGLDTQEFPWQPWHQVEIGDSIFFFLKENIEQGRLMLSDPLELPDLKDFSASIHTVASELDQAHSQLAVIIGEVTANDEEKVEFNPDWEAFIESFNALSESYNGLYQFFAHRMHSHILDLIKNLDITGGLREKGSVLESEEIAAAYRIFQEAEKLNEKMYSTLLKVRDPEGAEDTPITDAQQLLREMKNPLRIIVQANHGILALKAHLLDQEERTKTLLKAEELIVEAFKKLDLYTEALYQLLPDLQEAFGAGEFTVTTKAPLELDATVLNVSETFEEIRKYFETSNDFLNRLNKLGEELNQGSSQHTLVMSTSSVETLNSSAQDLLESVLEQGFCEPLGSTISVNISTPSELLSTLTTYQNQTCRLTNALSDIVDTTHALIKPTGEGNQVSVPLATVNDLGDHLSTIATHGQSLVELTQIIDESCAEDSEVCQVRSDQDETLLKLYRSLFGPWSSHSVVENPGEKLEQSALDELASDVKTGISNTDQLQQRESSKYHFWRRYALYLQKQDHDAAKGSDLSLQADEDNRFPLEETAKIWLSAYVEAVYSLAYTKNLSDNDSLFKERKYWLTQLVTLFEDSLSTIHSSTRETWQERIGKVKELEFQLMLANHKIGEQLFLRDALEGAPDEQIKELVDSLFSISEDLAGAEEIDVNTEDFKEFLQAIASLSVLGENNKITIQYDQQSQEKLKNYLEQIASQLLKIDPANHFLIYHQSQEEEDQEDWLSIIPAQDEGFKESSGRLLERYGMNNFNDEALLTFQKTTACAEKELFCQGFFAAGELPWRGDGTLSFSDLAQKLKDSSSKEIDTDPEGPLFLSTKEGKTLRLIDSALWNLFGQHDKRIFELNSKAFTLTFADKISSMKALERTYVYLSQEGESARWNDILVTPDEGEMVLIAMKPAIYSSRSEIIWIVLKPEDYPKKSSELWSPDGNFDAGDAIQDVNAEAHSLLHEFEEWQEQGARPDILPDISLFLEKNRRLFDLVSSLPLGASLLLQDDEKLFLTSGEEISINDQGNIESLSGVALDDSFHPELIVEKATIEDLNETVQKITEFLEEYDDTNKILLYQRFKDSSHITTEFYNQDVKEWKTSGRSAAHDNTDHWLRDKYNMPHFSYSDLLNEVIVPPEECTKSSSLCSGQFTKEEYMQEKLSMIVAWKASREQHDSDGDSNFWFKHSDSSNKNGFTQLATSLKNLNVFNNLFLNTSDMSHEVTFNDKLASLLPGEKTFIYIDTDDHSARWNDSRKGKQAHEEEYILLIPPAGSHRTAPIWIAL